MKIKLLVILIGTLLVGCDQIKNQLDQSKDKLHDKVKDKIKEKTRELTKDEEKNADDLYIAIRDKDIETIKKLIDPRVFENLNEDVTLLPELSALIPYYDPLLKKSKINFGNQYVIGKGHFLKVTYEYDYGSFKNYYSVTFNAEQNTKNIVEAYIQQE